MSIKKMKSTWKIASMIFVIGVLLLGSLTMVNAVSASDYDLTTDETTLNYTINGAIWERFQPDTPTGSGTFNSFLRIQATGSEQGYNTDYRPLEFDELKSATFTHSFMLADVPIIYQDGEFYREFQLDINEKNSNPNWYISLDKFKVFQTENASLTGYPDEFPEPVYDLDGDGDTWIMLDYRANAGSGKRDYRVLIPNDNFNENIPYVVIYAMHGAAGGQWVSDSGYEEWGARIVETFESTTSTILYKEADPSDIALPGGGAHTVKIGDVVYDTATVSTSIGTPIGDVQFQYMMVGDAGWTDLGDPVALDVSGKATSINWNATVAGTYYFRAIYSGGIVIGMDGIILASQSGDTEEPLIVDKNETDTTTQLYKVVDEGEDIALTSGVDEHTVLIGDVVYDTAEVTDGTQSLEGEFVQFQYMMVGDLDWTDLGDPVVLDANGKAKSINWTAMVAGTYYFRAVFEETDEFYGSESGDTEEPLIVDKNETDTTTQLYKVVDEGEDIALTSGVGEHTVLIGDVVYDTAEVTDGTQDVEGQVQFQFMMEGDIYWTDLGDLVTLDAEGKARSIDWEATVGGNYFFRAVFIENDEFYGSESGDTEEPLIVDKNDTDTTTQLYLEAGETDTALLAGGDHTVLIGDIVYDTAEVTDGTQDVEGEVQFQYMMEGDAGWTDLGDPVTLVDGKARSIDWEATIAGNYFFRAVFIENDEFYSSESGDTEEPLIVEANYMDQTVWAKLIDPNEDGEDPDAIGFSGTGNWGWYNGPIQMGDIYTFELWAGAAKNDTSKGMQVGELTVEYKMDGTVAWETTLWGGVLAPTGAHVYISTSDTVPKFPKDFMNVDVDDEMGIYEEPIYFAYHSSMKIPMT